MSQNSGFSSAAVGMATAAPRPSGSGFGFMSMLERLPAPTGAVLAVIAIVYGWMGRESRELSAADGFGYWLGVAGGTLMLALLLYSVRKRIPWLRHLGATRHWFRMHMTLGIVGPIIILYHSNFQLGSLNSQVALYCTLIVAASGVIGRYFYSGIHDGLYGNKLSLRQLVAAVEAGGEERRAPAITAQLNTELANLATEVLQQSDAIRKSWRMPLTIGWRTRSLYRELRRGAYQHINELAAVSPTVKKQRRRLRRVTRKYLKRRLFEIRKVAQFQFFERLFSLWHVVHVPFFLMMVISAILHVLAVHMY